MMRVFTRFAECVFFWLVYAFAVWAMVASLVMAIAVTRMFFEQFLSKGV